MGFNSAFKGLKLLKKNRERAFKQFKWLRPQCVNNECSTRPTSVWVHVMILLWRRKVASFPWPMDRAWWPAALTIQISRTRFLRFHLHCHVNDALYQGNCKHEVRCSVCLIWDPVTHVKSNRSALMLATHSHHMQAMMWNEADGGYLQQLL